MKVACPLPLTHRAFNRWRGHRNRQLPATLRAEYPSCFHLLSTVWTHTILFHNHSSFFLSSGASPRTGNLNSILPSYSEKIKHKLASPVFRLFSVGAKRAIPQKGIALSCFNLTRKAHGHLTSEAGRGTPESRWWSQAVPTHPQCWMQRGVDRTAYQYPSQPCLPACRTPRTSLP